MPTLFLTGAGRGIGLALTRAYLEDGWTVHACAREPGTPELADLAPRHGDRLVRHRLDVTDHAAIDALAHDLDDVAIDLLINNAGIYGPSGQVLGNLDYAGWAETLAVNTLAPTRVVEAFHPRAVKGGTLATVTSQMGSIGENTSGGYIAYRASKAAVNAAMRCIALALAPEDKRVVVIHPGWVRTDMGGPAAPLSPEQSVASMRRVLAGIGPEHTGRFLNYDGREIAW